MLRIIICDETKTNISYVNKTVSNIISNILIRDEIEVFSVSPDTLVGYDVKDNYTYIFILDVIYKNFNGINIAKRIRKQFKDVFIIFITRHVELMYMVVNQNIMPSGFFGKPASESDIRRPYLMLSTVIGK